MLIIKIKDIAYIIQKCNSNSTLTSFDIKKCLQLLLQEYNN